MIFSFATVLDVVRRLAAYRVRRGIVFDCRPPDATARRWARLYRWMGFALRGLVFEALAGRYSAPAGLVCKRHKILEVPHV